MLYLLSFGHSFACSLSVVGCSFFGSFSGVSFISVDWPRCLVCAAEQSIDPVVAPASFKLKPAQFRVNGIGFPFDHSQVDQLFLVSGSFIQQLQQLHYYKRLWPPPVLYFIDILFPPHLTSSTAARSQQGAASRKEAIKCGKLRKTD